MYACEGGGSFTNTHNYSFYQRLVAMALEQISGLFDCKQFAPGKAKDAKIEINDNGCLITDRNRGRDRQREKGRGRNNTHTLYVCLSDIATANVGNMLP